MTSLTPTSIPSHPQPQDRSPIMSKLEAEQHLNGTIGPVQEGVEGALERRASMVHALMYPTGPRVEFV